MSLLTAERPAEAHGLRYYQTEAVDAVFGRLKEDRSTMMVWATGLGKTVAFCDVAKRWPGKVLILAHRDELVNQARRALERATGEWVEIEQGMWRAGEQTRLVVGSVQTIYQEARLKRFGPEHFDLIIIDECFPAGTLIDGRPIETIRPGDMISAVDHSSGSVGLQRVKSVSQRIAKDMMVLQHGATEISCTKNHPFFVRGRGYVEAKSLVQGDVLCVRGSVREGSCVGPEGSDLLGDVHAEELIGDHGAHKPHSRLGEDGEQQSDVEFWCTGEDEGFTPAHWARSIGTWRERQWGHSGGAGDPSGAGTWLGTPDGRDDAHAEKLGISDLLQDRRGQSDAESGGRGGWIQPLLAGKARSGREEGYVLAWARLDRVESLEQAGAGGTTVYNLEVEGAHTYFANDVLVHNCHHAIAPTYQKICEFFSSAKILGVTATPDRADEKAMGKAFDSVAHVMDIEDGIDAGYLVPIRGRRETLEQIDISGVSTSNGDLTIGQLDEVMVKAVEGIVHKTLELEPDRQAVCFFPGVQSAALACERFNARIPDSAIFIHGGTDPDERKSLVSRFKKKHFTYLCNCMIATEGFDCPDVSLIVLGRPTKSRSLYSQMVGRGTRVLPHVIDHIEGLEGAELRKQSIASSKKPDMMILDFVGNSGKHSLVGIEDILGGKYSEEEVELAKKKTGENPGVNPRDALAAARAQMQAMAKALRAQRVISSGEVFDPFKAFGLESDDREERYSRRFGFKPMTQPQRQSLINAGFLPNELENMDIRKASKAIAERFRRIDRGLASVKQLRKLREHGVLAEAGLSFVAASRGIDYIASECGWGRKKPVDPHRIHEILVARQPGEEG